MLGFKSIGIQIFSVPIPVKAASLIEDESHFLLSRGLSPEKETKSQPAPSTVKNEVMKMSKESKLSKTRTSKSNGRTSNGSASLKNGKSIQEAIKIFNVQ